jgi:hypothetical protein
MIGIFIFNLIISYDTEYKVLVTIVLLSLIIYIAVPLEILPLILIIFPIMLFLVSLGNETFRNRIFSFYQTIIINTKKLRKKNKNSDKEIEGESEKAIKEKILFWLTRIKILQGTLEKPEEKLGNQEYERLIQNSWLQNFFSDNSHYGLEIISHRDFTWTYIMKASSKEQATIQGEALLTKLLSMYPGIDGKVEIVPMTKEKLYKKNRYWEIKLPKPPYLEQLTLISDIINLFHRNNQKLKLYIMWKKEPPKKIIKIRDKISQMKFKDEDEKEFFLKMWQDELYKVRIYVTYEIIHEEPEAKANELNLIEGRLLSLTMSGKNEKNGAILKRVPSGTRGNIFRGNFFSGRYVTPLCLDFNIPEIIPLSKPFILENENIIHVDKLENDINYIAMGRHVNRGRRTPHKILIHKNNFAQSCGIFGQQGTGKTYLLAQIIKEFYEKRPDIGILILNLGKGNQEGFYKTDRVIKFGSDKFSIPYFFEGEYLEKSLQETATYLIASTGLKNVVEKNMLNVLHRFIQKFGKPPRSLKHLFDNLLSYFKAHPYHIRFQTNILRALKNRVMALLSNPLMDKALKNTGDIPLWFIDWRKGKKIYLDMSMCTLYEKRLLTNAIFQMIRALTPDVELGKLQNIIVIDEAHQILEKPITHNYDDDDFISRDQLEKIFNDLLREFRSKGLSFILSDQTPSRLFDCVTTLPSLKIIFRVGYPCNTTMIGNSKEQDFLILQKNRQALVFNGITGEKYIIETLDFTPPNAKPLEEMTEKEKEIICPYCKTEVDNVDSFCNYCGKPLIAEIIRTPNRLS